MSERAIHNGLRAPQPLMNEAEKDITREQYIAAYQAGGLFAGATGDSNYEAAKAAYGTDWPTLWEYISVIEGRIPKP